MCRRFASAVSQDRLCSIFATTDAPASAWTSRWNVAPGDHAPVIRRSAKGARGLALLGWGFAGGDGRRHVNARAETIRASRLFGDAFNDRRCLVPVTAFYEWRRTGAALAPFAFARMDGRPAALGAVWEGTGFALLTVPAGAPVRDVHDRAPLLIEEEDWPLWLGERPDGPDRLLRTAAPWVLRRWPVGPAVDAEASEGAALLEPID